MNNNKNTSRAWSILATFASNNKKPETNKPAIKKHQNEQQKRSEKTN